MSKTWKDLPKDVSGYKPFRKRKKPLSDKLKEPPEAEVLKALEVLGDNELLEDWYYYKDSWSA